MALKIMAPEPRDEWYIPDFGGGGWKGGVPNIRWGGARQLDRRDMRKVASATPGRAVVSVPVGPGVASNLPRVPTVNVVPPVVKPRPDTVRVLQPVNRKSPVPAQAVSERVAAPTIKTISAVKETNVGIDLGNLLGKAIGGYVDIKTAQYAPPVTQWGGAGYGVNPNMLAAPQLIDNQFGLPGVEVIGEANLDKGLVYKKVCGEYRWVKQKRRRRRKLLTDADFNALLRIQALKVNTNMTIAIAKALGR